jgi:hypothetical protein
MLWRSRSPGAVAGGIALTGRTLASISQASANDALEVDEDQARRFAPAYDWRMSQAIPQTSPEYDRTRILERPDGFYWQKKDGGRESGPFATLIEAVADMQAADESEVAPEETLEEAESELGISGYRDPDTGELAEEERPRLEEH